MQRPKVHASTERSDLAVRAIESSSRFDAGQWRRRIREGECQQQAVFTAKLGKRTLASHKRLETSCGASRAAGVSISTPTQSRVFSLSIIRFAFIVGSAVWGAAAFAADIASDPANSLPTVTVIGTTPIPGTSIDIDKIPGNVQILTSSDLSREGSPSLTGALDSNLSSVNINDDDDDPFQPDILYRGFEASPVLGTPEGLAVYQNGVRINEAFGNTVNWDLFPDVAINQVELVSSSPLYGLNALGGALSVTMKNGFTYQGGQMELSGGSYGQHSALGQFGMNSGPFAFYVAARALNWDGWRDFSDDRIRTLYASLSYHTEGAAIDFGYTRAQNVLEGQGPAPVQELALDRSYVFTGPQNNINDLNFFTLNGAFRLSNTWSLQSTLYYRNYAQSVSNGNTTDYEACTTIPGILCQPDGVTPLMNAQGQTLPDISDGGTKYIGENDFELIHAWGRGATLQLTNNDPIVGLANQFSVGAAFDYALSSYFTGAQIGLINPQLWVLPSTLIVDTPENSPGAIANGDPVPVSVDSVTQSLGAYLTDTLNVTPDLALTASGRYNIAHIDLEDQLGTNLYGDNRFVHLNPAIGATYRALPSTTLYGGYSTNTRTPTASEIECSNPLTPCLLPTNLAGDPPSLRQVVAHTSEVGLRGKLSDAGSDGQVSWNLSVFRTLLHDDIYGIATSVSSGFFANIGDTRRQGIEAGLAYHSSRLSAYANYSLVQATFRSAFVEPSPSNPFQNAAGNLLVEPGDMLPGIPQHRVKVGADFKVIPQWVVGTSVKYVGSFYYVGDESNQLAPIPGYTVVNLHSTYRPMPHLEFFASIDNLLNRKYATWGILSDPTGIGAPGIPVDAVTNGPGVNNRFLSPAAPFEAFVGVRIGL
jgi:iron complex outermembrane recepter protein